MAIHSRSGDFYRRVVHVRAVQLSRADLHVAMTMLEPNELRLRTPSCLSSVAAFWLRRNRPLERPFSAIPSGSSGPFAPTRRRATVGQNRTLEATSHFHEYDVASFLGCLFDGANVCVDGVFSGHGPRTGDSSVLASRTIRDAFGCEELSRPRRRGQLFRSLADGQQVRQGFDRIFSLDHGPSRPSLSCRSPQG